MLLVLGDNWFEDRPRPDYRLLDVQDVLSGSPQAQVLTIGKPGYLMDGLRSMIKSIQGLMLLDAAYSMDAGWQVCCTSCPDIVVVDMITCTRRASCLDFSPQNVYPFVQRCKQEHNNIAVLLIVERQAECNMALKAGADSVLLQSFSADQLSRALRRLVPRQKGLL